MPSYSSSDIEKYLSGELSAPEMHAMERAALDDPFLADALEGMIIHQNQNLPGQPSFREDMTGLHKKLEDRITQNKGKVRPLVMKYAAAVILLLGLGTTAYYMFFTTQKARSPLAASKIVPSTTPAVTQDAPVAMDTPAARAADSASVSLGLVSNKPKTSTARSIGADKSIAFEKSSLTSDQYRAAPLQKHDDSLIAAFNNVNNALDRKVRGLSTTDKDAIPDTLMLTRDSAIFNGAFADIEPKAAKLYKKVAEPMVFKGRVINPQNIPLSGATLSLKRGQEQVNAVTDVNGYFTMKLPKYDTVQKVVVNYVGYEQGYVKLNTDDRTGNIIQLRPQSSSLDEVAVVGFGAKRKELTRTDINATPLPLSQTAFPADGWPAYNKYLESNKNSPQIDSTIRGYESISFIVNSKGQFSSFKVERSLSPAHDSLAIRLIKEGPSWKLLKGRKERARVILTW